MSQPAHKPLVCIVEDDAGTREVMALALELEGFSVTAFGSGEEMLDALDGLSPCGLVTDLSLQGMSGTEMARRVRARERPVGLIALTGWDPNSLSREDAALFQRVLLKPVPIEVLTAALRALCPG